MGTRRNCIHCFRNVKMRLTKHGDFSSLSEHRRYFSAGCYNTCRSRSERANRLSNRVWADVDEMTRLPGKILSLVRRIQNASPSSPLREPRAKRLAKDLLYRVVRSSRIMTVITGTGFLSLFQESVKIRLLAPNHYYQAIRTLLAMVQAKNSDVLADCVDQH